MEGQGKRLSGDVEEELNFRKVKLEDEDEQKNKDTRKLNQDDGKLQGMIDAAPEAHGRHTPDILGLTPDATLLSGNTGPERPVALTPAQSENSTSNTSPHTLLAKIQSAPLTPNSRVYMPPTAGESDQMHSHPSLSPAPKPIAKTDALGLSMSSSSYAPNYDTSKGPFVRDPVDSSMNPRNVQVKRKEKEKSRRPNRVEIAIQNSHQYSLPMTKPIRKLVPSLLSRARIYISCITPRGIATIIKSQLAVLRRETEATLIIKKTKSSKIPLHVPSHGGKTFVPSPRTISFPTCFTKTTLKNGRTLFLALRTKRVPTRLAKVVTRQCSPNPSGEAKVNALDNPNIQTSCFASISFSSEKSTQDSPYHIHSDAMQAGHAD